ncbi:MAG: FAD-dependent oxidoreductase [Chitinophagaceae bacterium]|nr:FAD-dependent oxidoreductase [Chitinophagaceae bacterium]
MKISLLLTFLILPVLVAAQHPDADRTDVLVIGGGTGGTAAAIQSARLGARTILVESASMFGGMLTAAGVSCADGNDQLPSGIWEEFRQALYKHYGTKNLNTGWVSNTCFEPHVGDSIFKSWAKKEKILKYCLAIPLAMYKAGNKVTGVSVTDETGKILKINAKVVIDATETGDVLAASGAAYDLGMDDPAVTNEKEAIQKNDIIQDLTWAAILKDYGPGIDKTITRPLNYDSLKYFCSTAEAPCNGKPYIYNTKKVLDYGSCPVRPAVHQTSTCLIGQLMEMIIT